VRPAHRLASVSIKNFKAFEESARLELHPLTIVFGRNAAGKSVVARLPLLLTEALGRPGAEGLPLKVRGVSFGTSLLDLLHGRLMGVVEVSVVVESGNATYEVSATIGPDAGGFARQPRQRIHHWSMLARADGRRVGLRWTRESDGAYELEGDPKLRGDIQFEGLLPVRVTGDIVPGLGVPWLPLFERKLTLPVVAHLGPFREPAATYYPLLPLPPDDVGMRGENAVALLGYHKAAGRADVVRAVSAWFLQHLGLELDLADVGVEESELGVVLKVRPEGRTTWMNIAEAGTGTVQVLPYVVQHATAVASQQDIPPPGIIVCEEPEAHLHPAAQAGLADLAIETALSGQSRVLLETHSETLLLRVRRRIAEKRISHEAVGLYWVDDEGGKTRLRRLDVEPDGWVADWPDGIFAEAAAEARAIGRANRRSAEEAG
jgi:AAA ATPase domain